MLVVEERLVELWPHHRQRLLAGAAPGVQLAGVDGVQRQQPGQRFAAADQKVGQLQPLRPVLGARFKVPRPAAPQLVAAAPQVGADAMRAAWPLSAFFRLILLRK